MEPKKKIDMIEFSGRLSEKSIADMAKTMRIKDTLVCTIALIVTSLITWLLVAFKILEPISFLAIVVIALIFAITIVAPFRSAVFRITKKITIDVDNILIEAPELRDSFLPKNKSVHKVKRVVDVGDCYYIIFGLSGINHFWICQKDLIVKGTLDEFEKIFEKRIVRKKGLNLDDRKSK